MIDKEIERTQEWVRTINLDSEGYPEKQILKNMEEALEVVEAYTDWQLCQAHDAISTFNQLKCEMGDNLVTLIALSMQLGMDLDECLSMANDKIYKRIDSGRMINGKFVKKEDLPG
jgi:NTP pyrophosphatase (non-canonical NTP hydrolase)